MLTWFMIIKEKNKNNKIKSGCDIHESCMNIINELIFIPNIDKLLTFYIV